MLPRTNFDVIDKNTNEIILKSREYDCFGQYTLGTKSIENFQNHIIHYFLPHQFLMNYYDNTIKINKEYKDKLIDNSENQIQKYIDFLNSILINSKITLLEDRLFTIDEIKSKYPSKIIDKSLTEPIPYSTVEIDLTKLKNVKDAKINLFFTRYLINNVGGVTLQNTFNTMKNHPDINFWDAFLMNELATFLKGSQGYSLFNPCGLFKYFTVDDLYDKLIYNDDGFDYLKSMTTSGIQVYTISTNHPDYLKQNPYWVGINSANARKKIIKFIEKNNNNLDSKFLEFWKNYDWYKEAK